MASAGRCLPVRAPAFSDEVLIGPWLCMCVHVWVYFCWTGSDRDQGSSMRGDFLMSCLFKFPSEGMALH